MKIESIDFQILESDPVEPEWRPLRAMREYPEPIRLTTQKTPKTAV